MGRRLSSEQVVRPAKFAHVVLRTRKLEESIAWYRDLVGMEVVFGNDFAAFLSYDDEHHRLALVQTPQEQPSAPGAAGLDHVAYTLRDLGELLGTYRRLAARSILPVWSINHGPTTSLYYQDPDGNRVELQVDNFESAEEANAWMHSGAFEKNPIGVEFDPEELAARYEQGEAMTVLLARGDA